MLFVRDALAPAHCVLRVCQNWAAKIGHRLARIRGQRHVGDSLNRRRIPGLHEPTITTFLACMLCIVSNTASVAGVKVADHSGGCAGGSSRVGMPSGNIVCVSIAVCAPLRHRRHEDMYELRSVRNLVTSKRPDTADTRKQLMLTFLAREEKMFD